MTLEQRIEALEKEIKDITERHKLEDKELQRVKAAVSHAAKKGIEDLLAKQT
ncbi:hypothetical protein HII27_21180 [Kluyvera sp. SCKS090646]|uniref:Uncharacterized protein n=1 Tax=Kluyvera sichuanensis TaxID=2725494 RepID=A0ABR6RYK3_9ENTR|nr:hypothetical protein [Kluyvera sichuanensis]MBC1188217.1 hypothetical protein [Kluyvera sichuanensis]HDG1697541.1 hypothetical protein [Kluyvera ascorbata]